MKFMNSKMKKEFLKIVVDQFGICYDKQNNYLQNAEGKVYMINRDVERVNFEDFRIDKMGLYLGKMQIDGFRPSIEGSQLLKHAVKNVLELDKENKHLWMMGADLAFENESDRIVIVKSGNDFLGAGKISKGKLLTGVPKARRLNTVND